MLSSSTSLVQENHPTDMDQIQALYLSHQGWLQRLLYSRLKCRENAADITQDTFTRLIARREKVYVSEAKALLATIAKGLVVDFYRRSALEAAYIDALLLLPEAEAPSPECQAILLETLIEVDRMLDSLKPKARQAFLLAQLDGLPYAKIAERMGVSEASIHKYMAQGYSACYRVAYRNQS